MTKYFRDDIYFCTGCGYFHDVNTDKRVHIPLDKLPAEVAIAVLKIRNGVLRREPPNSKRGKPKGFGKK